MNIESQVTSIELSKRLHELGVKQESLFHWNNGKLLDGDPFLNHHSSAFTASELLELLPAIIENNYYLTIVKLDNLHHIVCDYKDWKENESFILWDTESETLSDSLAKILIHLIENKLWEIKS